MVRRRCPIAVLVLSTAVLAPVSGLYTGSTTGCIDTRYVTPDYTKAYTLDSTLPPGCTCKASDVAMKECTVYDCTCVCDLTAGQCDYGCCCDPECSEEEVLRFETGDGCLPEGPGHEAYTKCWDASQMPRVNPVFPLSVSSSGQKALDNLLCVVADHSESKGRFLEDPGFPGSAVFLQSWGQKEYTYIATSTEAARSSATSYTNGDPIPAGFNNGGYQARAAYGGYMPLPAPDASGQCNENNFVGFGEVTQSSSCVRVVDPTAIASDCHALFGAYRFTKNLQVAVSPDGTPAPSGASTFLNVTISQVKYRDPFTLEESTFSGYDCDAYYTTHSTAMAGCSAPRSLVGHTATGYCRNAVVSICYDLSRNAEGTLTGASARLVVTDLLVNATSSLTSVAQAFSVSFRSSASVTRTAAAGNLMDRSRSGNPGYLYGLPLLAGIASSDSTGASVIRAQQPGMALPAVSLTGDCGDGMGDLPVNFGVDVRAGCSLTLTRDELEAMCGGGGSYMSGDIPSFFNVTTTHIGIFGNADPLDVTQWLPLDTSLTSATYLWDDKAGTCSNLITSVNYRFLVAEVGKANNPQRKIVAAQVEYGKEDLRFRAEASSTQAFVFSTTVTFIDSRLEEQSAVYTPPPPPVVFSVPYDVFYPFQVYSPAPPALMSSAWMRLLPLATLLWLVYGV